MKKLILRNHQSPGDIVMLTAAVRDLHRCYPEKYLTDVRTSCPELWLENPHLTPLEESDPGVDVIDCHYPLIARSNHLPKHFLFAFIEFLNERLGLRIEPTAFHGDIHLHESERQWTPQVMELTGEDTPYWIIVAGGKYDYTIKWWDAARWQQVVDHFRGRLQFVQVGRAGHHHPALAGVIDLRGKTDLRQLIRLVHHAQGVVCPVTGIMHLAAAVPVRAGRPQNRACVVVAGGREPPAWEAYPHHQFIHTNGQLMCCDQGGCWKARTVARGDGDEKDRPEALCVLPMVVREKKQANGEMRYDFLPRCMEMITAAEVIRRIEGYFTGGAYPWLTAAEARGAENSNPGAKQLTAPELRPALNGDPRPPRERKKATGPGAREHRMIAVTIGIGEKWELLARLAAESCRESTGLETFILGEEAMRRYGYTTPHHLKYKLFHEFPDADSILYFDADTIFLQPFEARAFIDRPVFPCVRDLYESEAVVREEAGSLRLPPENYFNSGFFIVQRAFHATFLEKAQWLTGRQASMFKDQTFLNGARHMLGTPILYLPREYNMLGFDRARDTSRVVIGHFHLIDQRPIGEIEDYHRQWRARGRACAARRGRELADSLRALLAIPPPGPPAPPVAPRPTAEEKRYRALLEREVAARRRYPAGRFAGRGIVICGGGTKYFPCAWVTIRLLRHLGCRLPIELWHIGPNEMSPAMRALLAPLGVQTVDGLEVRQKHPVVSLRGWELKAYALLHCRFAEVLLLDADNAPVRDPSDLFDEPEYRQKGAIFWPDFWTLPEKTPIWRVMGVPYREEPAFESGQIVVDKRKCWKALYLAGHLNEHSAWYYRFIHGDKDTFHLAWTRLGQPYAMPNKRLEALEATMCQHDLQGRRLFQHRNADKWRIDGRNRTVPGFKHEPLCRRFLEELRRRWFPTTLGVRRWDPFATSPALRATARALVRQPWSYHRVGHDRRPLRLRADGLVGRGAAAQEFYWHLRPSPSGPVLEIFSTTRRTCRLLRGRDGVWRGRWEICEQMPIELTHLPASSQSSRSLHRRKREGAATLSNGQNAAGKPSATRLRASKPTRKLAKHDLHAGKRATEMVPPSRRKPKRNGKPPADLPRVPKAARKAPANSARVPEVVRGLPTDLRNGSNGRRKPSLDVPDVKNRSRKDYGKVPQRAEIGQNPAPRGRAMQKSVTLKTINPKATAKTP